MDRPRFDRHRERTFAQITDSEDLRSVVAEALAASPPDLQALRRGVWMFVMAERHAGTSPRQVLMSLGDIVEVARLEPGASRHALTHQMTVWCVEAYFGHIGDDVRDGHPSPSSTFAQGPVTIDASD